MVGLFKLNFVLLVALTLSIFNKVSAIIFEYEDLKLENNILKYRSSYMYSAETAPALDTRDPSSFISFEFNFLLNNDHQDNVAQVTIFKGVPGDFLGENHKYCCSMEDVKGGVCKVVNQLYIPENIKHETFLVEFNEGEVGPDSMTSVDVRGSFKIREKGLYTIMFSFCQPETSEILINGHARWRNPYGYLTGEYYGFLNFFANLSIAYLLCAGLWAYVCARNWRELLMLQNCITAVIALGMIEVMLRYSDFHSLNATGKRNHALMLAGVTFATIKKTVSRMLVLVVGMGYGVVKPNLGEAGNKVTILGFVYLIVASVQHTVENLSMHSENGDSNTFPRIVLLIPVAALDTYFYFWIFRSIRTTVAQLEARGQEAKLRLYLAFQRVLIGSVVVTACWAVLYIFVRIFEFKKFEWQHIYILDGFWECLYLAILIAIMWLWRPTKNSQRYAYTQVKTYEHDEEEYDDQLEDNVTNGATKQIPVDGPANEMIDLIGDKPVVAKSD